MADIDRYLYELAESPPDSEPRVTAEGGQLGIALPEVGPLGLGVIVKEEYARKLGAQLLREARKLDDIREAAQRELER